MKKLFIILGLLLSAGCSHENSDSASISNLNSNSIIGGKVVDKEIFAKHVVAIRNNDDGYYCSGTLISQNTILTASHCIESGKEHAYTIYFGKDPRSFESVSRPVTSMAGNTGFNESALTNRKDIGIIRFQGALPEGFEPMSLPTSRDLQQMGRDFYSAGYGAVTGRTDIPRDGGILRYTLQKFVGDRISPLQPEFFANQNNGQGICFGDSGGPAFIKLNGRRILLGVSSAMYTVDPEDKNKPEYDICRQTSIFTNVVYFLDWIKKTQTSLR